MEQPGNEYRGPGSVDAVYRWSEKQKYDASGKLREVKKPEPREVAKPTRRWADEC